MSGQIFLCFTFYEAAEFKQCRKASGPLEVFSEISSSNYDHRHARLVNSDSKSNFLSPVIFIDCLKQLVTLDQLVTVGGWKSYTRNAKTELYQNGDWTYLPDYPFVSVSHSIRIHKLRIIIDIHKLENSLVIPSKDLFIYSYVAIYHQQYFYFFGGLSGSSSVQWTRTNIIARLESAPWKWTSVGTLRNGRHGHAVILVDDRSDLISSF